MSVIRKYKKINFESTYIKIHGELIKNNLYEINDSEKIVKKISKGEEVS